MLPKIRLAVIADVHGKAFALEAVVKDVRAASPDIIANLGDQVWGRADPARSYALQQALGAVEVRGNNDEKLIRDTERLGTNGATFRDWLIAQLPHGAAAHLAGLPLTAEVADGQVLLAHGTPRDANHDLVWRWRPGGWMMRTARELRDLLTDVTAEVILVGHTHREGALFLDGRLLVNIGSVGWQIDGNPRARWTLLERRGGRWSVEFRQVVYNYGAAAACVL